MDFQKHLKILPDTLQKYQVPFDDLRAFRKSFKEFPVQKNKRLTDAFQSVAPFDRAPVWIMRQAGRYLPEFKEISKDYDFFQKCENPFIAAEITLQPTRRLDLDGAIIFADILTLPRFMGFDIAMEEQKGPVIKNPLVTPEDIARIHPPNPEDLEHVYDAQFLVKLALEGRQSLIGFCGGPWTVFSYLVEGGTSKAFTKSKRWLYIWREETMNVLEQLAVASADYLINQVKQGGAQVLQIFDSWAGYLYMLISVMPAQDYIAIVIPSLKTLLTKFKTECPNTPIIMFAKDQNNRETIDVLLSLNLNGLPLIDGFQLDHFEDDVLVKIIEADRTVQGNLEPGVLYGSFDLIQKRVQQTIERLQVTRRYVVNLAHGLTPEHQVENVKYFVDESIKQSLIYKARDLLQ